MSDARRTRAELAAELRALRKRVAKLERAEGSAREARRLAEARCGHVLASAGAAVVEMDAKGVVTYASPTLVDLLGYQPEEISTRAALEWVHEDDREDVVELHGRLLSTGRSERGLFRARHKAGHWLWLETQGTTYRTPDGAVRSLVFTRDVTPLQLADAALRESEARYRALAENATDLISEVDESGRLLFTTPNCLEILGYPADRLIGHTMLESPHFENIHPDDRERTLEAYQRALSADGVGEAEYRYRHANGEWRRLQSRARAYRTEAGALRFAVISRDVTQRVSDQLALRSSEERYRELASTTHDLVVELDGEGKVVFISPNARELLGFAPEELVGTTPFALVHPEDIERAVELFLSREPGRPRRPAQFRVRHRDGSCRLFEGGGFDYPTASGEMHLVGVVRDITEAAQAEQDRRDLQERMAQVRRLEGLGVMAGGVAHDFNNLLTPILGDASLVLMDLPEDSPLRPRLVKVQRAARRAAELTGKLLSYAGEETLRSQLLELSKLLDERRVRFESGVTPRARLHFELAEGLPPIEGDAAQLCQVTADLLANAFEALGEGGGHVWLRTGSVEADRRHLSRRLFGNGLTPGTYVYLEIEDSGRGMDEATRERIFEPFFSTKFTGRGLGLASVLGVVRGHGGAIEIDTAVGRGSRFRLLLPAARASLPTA